MGGTRSDGFSVVRYHPDGALEEALREITHLPEGRSHRFREFRVKSPWPAAAFPPGPIPLRSRPCIHCSTPPPGASCPSGPGRGRTGAPTWSGCSRCPGGSSGAARTASGPGSCGRGSRGTTGPGSPRDATERDRRHHRARCHRCDRNPPRNVDVRVPRMRLPQTVPRRCTVNQARIRIEVRPDVQGGWSVTRDCGKL